MVFFFSLKGWFCRAKRWKKNKKKVAWIKKKRDFAFVFWGEEEGEYVFKWQFPSSLKRLPKDGPKDGGCDGGSSTAPGWEREGGKKAFSSPFFFVFVCFFVCFVLFVCFSRGKGDGVSQEQPNLERGKEKKKKRGGVGWAQ